MSARPKRLVTAALTIALLAGSAVASGGSGWAAEPPEPATAGTSAVTQGVSPSPAQRIAKLTGPNSINKTDSRWQVKATDLGIIWDNGSGEVLTAFGDTFGNGWTGPGGGVGDPATLDWRCNVLARSSDRELADGMSFSSMVTDRPGHAGEILPCKKINHDEMTVIPTAGISVGSRQYIHYMSVHHWGDPGKWYTNYAGIAYSDNNGQTWTKDADARWRNGSPWTNKFQVGAMVQDDGYVYLYGTPNGRFGNVHLARVPERQLLDPRAYRYWNGSSWGTDQNAAAAVAGGPAGEVSVQYSRYLNKWLMMYLDESRHAIVLRSSPSPVGPWSGEEVVADSTAYPKLYGSYIHPWSADSNSPYLYFTMSQWDPYNVYLMRTRLSGGGILGGSSADFTGDGKDDIATFTQNPTADVYVAASTGTSFAGHSVKWNDFFAPGGETPYTGDFDGDGKDDAVTFTHGAKGDVYVGLSSGSSFGQVRRWHDWFAPGKEIPAIGDFNGDGKDDIATFTSDDEADVYVALSDGSSFGAGQKWHDFFAPRAEFPAVGDVNGDGKDDIITFTRGAAADVYVSLSTGSGFGAAKKVHDFFAPEGEQPRIGDVNGDGKDDIITFTSNQSADVYVALSNGSGFGAGQKWHDFFAAPGEFPYVGDYNGDGRDDIVTFTQTASADVYVATSTGSSFSGHAVKWHDFFGLPGETTL